MSIRIEAENQKDALRAGIEIGRAFQYPVLAKSIRSSDPDSPSITLLEVEEGAAQVAADEDYSRLSCPNKRTVSRKTIEMTAQRYGCRIIYGK